MDYILNKANSKLCNFPKSEINEYGLKPFSKEELLKRIEASEEDFKNNRRISLEDFIAEADKW